MSRLHRSLTEVPTLTLFWGRRVLGAVWGSLMLPFLLHRQHKVAPGREDPACKNLLLNPCRMWQGQKGLLCRRLSFVLGNGGGILRRKSLCPHCSPWPEIHWQGEVLLCHSEHVPHCLSVLGSVTKACMILRSIEELQHKPGMVSKTQSELCEVFPL